MVVVVMTGVQWCVVMEEALVLTDVVLTLVPVLVVLQAIVADSEGGTGCASVSDCESSDVRSSQRSGEAEGVIDKC